MAIGRNVKRGLDGVISDPDPKLTPVQAPEVLSEAFPVFRFFLNKIWTITENIMIMKKYTNPETAFSEEPDFEAVRWRYW